MIHVSDLRRFSVFNLRLSASFSVNKAKDTNDQVITSARPKPVPQQVMSLKQVVLTEDELLHGCLSQTLSKSEMMVSMKITKFEPTQVERWGDEVVKYATRLGISQMLGDQSYPFKTMVSTKFTKMVEKLQAKVATTINNIQGVATPAPRPNPQEPEQEESRSPRASSPARNLEAEMLHRQAWANRHPHATPQYLYRQSSAQARRNDNRYYGGDEQAYYDGYPDNMSEASVATNATNASTTSGELSDMPEELKELMAEKEKPTAGNSKTLEQKARLRSRMLLTKRFEKSSVFYRVAHTGGGTVTIFTENAKITRKRRELWEAAIVSLVHHKHLYKDVLEGDILTLWEKVYTTGQPNVRDLFCTNLDKLCNLHKPKDLGFATWYAQVNTVYEQLEAVGLVVDEFWKIGYLLNLTKADTRYSRVRERIKESDCTLEECLSKFHARAVDLKDTSTSSKNATGQTPNHETHNTQQGGRSGKNGKDGKGTAKTEICRAYAKNKKCRFGKKCKFIHIDQKSNNKSQSSANSGGGDKKDDESKSPNDNNKNTKTNKKGVCYQFRESGQCPYGDKCGFAHIDTQKTQHETGMLEVLQHEETNSATSKLDTCKVEMGYGDSSIKIMGKTLSIDGVCQNLRQKLGIDTWCSFKEGDVVITRKNMGSLSDIKAQVLKVTVEEVYGKPTKIYSLQPLEVLDSEIQEALENQVFVLNGSWHEVTWM